MSEQIELVEKEIEHKPKSKKNLFIGIMLIVVAVGGLYGYFKYSEMYPDTENAYVNANIINISPEISGYVTNVLVKDNEKVTKGQVLFEIDPTDYQIQLDKSINDETFASSQYELSKVGYEKAKIQYTFDKNMADRYAELYKANATSKQVMEQYQITAEQSKLQLDLTQAQQTSALSQYENTKVAKANATNNYDRTKVRAPFDGYVSNMNLAVGQFVSTGQPLFGLIDDSSWWVDVNLKETQLKRIKINQPATVKLDMYDHTYKGVVENISYASGNTFSLLPAQNATGNWVKVTQRFTIRVHIDDNAKYPLRVGSSATVEIDTEK